MILVEMLSIETQLSTFFLQNDNKLTQNCQKLWREKTIKCGGFQCFRLRSCHIENYRYPNLYKKNILCFRIISYRFHVFQISGNPSLSIFTLLEPYDDLVHHTLNLKGIYTGGKLNTLLLEKKISLINCGTKRSHSQKYQRFFFD